MRTGQGKPPSRRLSAEEGKLWSDITRSVAPLRRRRALADPGYSPAPDKRGPLSLPARSAPTRSAPQLETFDRRLKQRLARGTAPIDARIDLHGKTQSAAYAQLLSFLRRVQAEGAKFVLVITGKGGTARDDAGERGVLKRQVPHWLELPEFRGYVVGFEHAHAAHGGAGALYVRVRRQKSGKKFPDF
jgi:DNA-nicking Smr family endonuclease